MSKEKKYRVNPVKMIRLIIIVIVLCALLVGAGYFAGKGSDMIHRGVLPYMGSSPMQLSRDHPAFSTGN